MNTAVEKNKKLKIISTIEQLNRFSSVILGMVPISDSVIIRFNKEDILFYAMVINNTNPANPNSGTIVAMKYRLDKTNNYFNITDADMEDIYNEDDFILPIISSKKLISKINFLKDKEIKIAFESRYINDANGKHNIVTNIAMSDGRFSVKTTAKDKSLIRIISSDVIEQVTNPSSVDWSFSMTPAEVTEVKNAMKLSTRSDGEEVEPLNIIYSAPSHGMVASQSEWKLKLGEVLTSSESMSSVSNVKITIGKGFFNAIPNIKENTRFNIYPTFIICGNTKTEAIILAYEQEY